MALEGGLALEGVAISQSKATISLANACFGIWEGFGKIDMTPASGQGTVGRGDTGHDPGDCSDGDNRMFDELYGGCEVLLHC